MITTSKVGDVDYEYDMYKNRVRKFVFKGHKGKGHDRTPIWEQVEEFEPERGFENIKREIS